MSNIETSPTRDSTHVPVIADDGYEASATSGWVLRGVTSTGRALRTLSVSGVLACIVAIAIVVFALVPWLVAPYDPTVGLTADRLQPPSPQHIFGTDNLGRDIFSRVIWGTQLSAGTALLAVLIAGVVGSAIGLLAGFIGRATDLVLMRIADILLSIPNLLLSMTIVISLGFSGFTVALAVGLASIASFSRLMRSDVIRVKSNVYIDAAVSAGVGRAGILFRHVLPNSANSVVVLAVLEFGSAMLAISALSFLGFGAQPPAPEWGSMVAGGRDYIATAWWMIFFPGAMVVVTVLSANRLAQLFAERRA